MQSDGDLDRGCGKAKGEEAERGYVEARHLVLCGNKRKFTPWEVLNCLSALRDMVESGGCEAFVIHVICYTN